MPFGSKTAPTFCGNCRALNSWRPPYDCPKIAIRIASVTTTVQYHLEWLTFWTDASSRTLQASYNWRERRPYKPIPSRRSPRTVASSMPRSPSVMSQRRMQRSCHKYPSRWRARAKPSSLISVVWCMEESVCRRHTGKGSQDIRRLREHEASLAHISDDIEVSGSNCQEKTGSCLCTEPLVSSRTVARK